jgi:DNA-binding transcriptional regulator YiaG
VAIVLGWEIRFRGIQGAFRLLSLFRRFPSNRFSSSGITSMHSENHPHHFSARIALGMRLKHWRSDRQLSIVSAAKALGVSTATWGHWETGEHLPNGDLLLAIEDFTRIPLHVLFCPHLDSCPQAKTGSIPKPGQPCCQCGRSTSDTTSVS